MPLTVVGPAPAPPPVTAAPKVAALKTAVEQTVPVTVALVALLPFDPVPADEPPAPLKLEAHKAM